MDIIENAEQMYKISLSINKNNKSIGFVPTMGALHEGHLSLVKESKKNNVVTIVSIFVNPIQFGPKEDLTKYPRTFESDCEMLKKEGVDFLFFPGAAEMYGENYETYVELMKLPAYLCGLSRPGHFRGVSTVVTKLFQIVRPDNAYFGQKDFQQCMVIKKLVRDLNFYIKINICKILRENDGLAMSSRNRYLNVQERKDALILYQSIKLAVSLIQNGLSKTDEIIKKMKAFIKKGVPYAKIDYINIVDDETLEDVKNAVKSNVIVLAVYIGKTRLIDNHIIE